ncbi:MAG TPA: TetR family transcriptional regulator [Acidobacteria bacterium]|nr:TetR family transcriptional regulator [Acidobacteriota bacterium]
MGIKERREREKAEIREKILEAARELFVSEGYEAVSMRKIADKIEYSPTAIYLHFKDKEAVLRELCESDFYSLAQEFHQIARLADPVERLQETGVAYARFALSHPNHYRLMFMTPHPVAPDEETRIERGNPEEDAYAFLKWTIGEVVAAGLVRPGFEDVESLAQTFWAGMHGVVSLQIAKCNDDWVDWRPTEERLRLMNEALLRGMLREATEGEVHG